MTTEPKTSPDNKLTPASAKLKAALAGKKQSDLTVPLERGQDRSTASARKSAHQSP